MGQNAVRTGEASLGGIGFRRLSGLQRTCEAARGSRVVMGEHAETN